jgi:hypothetical protein
MESCLDVKGNPSGIRIDIPVNLYISVAEYIMLQTQDYLKVFQVSIDL